MMAMTASDDPVVVDHASDASMSASLRPWTVAGGGSAI
jgi:hypothetical protein